MGDIEQLVTAETDITSLITLTVSCFIATQAVVQWML